jgi:hypothetical protein
MYDNPGPRILKAGERNRERNSKSRPLLSRRHSLDLIAEAPPIVGLQLGVFDSLLAPVLMQTADVILALLEVGKFITSTLLNEHPARVLLHD